MRMGLLNEEAKNIKPLNDTRFVCYPSPHVLYLATSAGEPGRTLANAQSGPEWSYDPR